MTIGWREMVALPKLGLPKLKAKIDTGARTSALHAIGMEEFARDGVPWVRFHIPDDNHEHIEQPMDCVAPLIDTREIRNTSGIPDERHIISTQLSIGGRRWTIEVSLTDRSDMKFPLILGRTAIRRRRILVNPGRSYLLEPHVAPERDET